MLNSSPPLYNPCCRIDGTHNIQQNGIQSPT